MRRNGKWKVQTVPIKKDDTERVVKIIGGEKFLHLFSFNTKKRIVKEKKCFYAKKKLLPIAPAIGGVRKTPPTQDEDLFT